MPLSTPETALRTPDAILQMACQAKAQYETARNTRAFNVLGATHSHKNQHGTVYRFSDGSWLVVSHSSNYIKWGTGSAAIAIRVLWDDRATRPGHKSRLETRS